MKYEIEITPDFQKAIEQVLHKALLYDGGNSFKEVNLITNVLSNLKEIIKPEPKDE